MLSTKLTLVTTVPKWLTCTPGFLILCCSHFGRFSFGGKLAFGNKSQTGIPKLFFFTTYQTNDLSRSNLLISFDRKQIFDELHYFRQCYSKGNDYVINGSNSMVLIIRSTHILISKLQMLCYATFVQISSKLAFH